MTRPIDWYDMLAAFAGGLVSGAWVADWVYSGAVAAWRAYAQMLEAQDTEKMVNAALKAYRSTRQDVQ